MADIVIKQGKKRIVIDEKLIERDSDDAFKKLEKYVKTKSNKYKVKNKQVANQYFATFFYFF